MRNLADRIRHTLLFEGIAIVLVMLFAVFVLDRPLTESGPLALLLSVIAMAWNFAYNVGFDAMEQAAQPGALPSQRKTKIRVVHALGFEGGFLLMCLPLIAAWLNVGLWEAFLLDLGFALFFLVYAYVFNWGYDRLFPLPTYTEITAA